MSPPGCALPLPRCANPSLTINATTMQVRPPGGPQRRPDPKAQKDPHSWARGRGSCQGTPATIGTIYSPEKHSSSNIAR
ncbi:hypothetical protein E2C01_012023 [Portunus trituberculatus]|uniref:Uncharacterized protein n=1 Tax=Portunus trituberculatus TaxID=210409 RepID=A0A5B7DDI2_PORTR|nr:hypothetical protein [Portunus trituberculatus]